MDDYISRAAVIKDLLADTVIADDLFGMGTLHERDRVIAKINDFPAADVRPVVRGEWEQSEDEFFSLKTIQCSLCRGEWCFEDDNDVFDLGYNFCPNCGAEMRKGDN